MNSSLPAQVLSHLKTSKSLVPTQAWLGSFLSSQRPATPINVLVSSAAFRLLAADITGCLDHTTCLPADIHNAAIKDRRVAGPVIAQVLDVEDMSKSRWEQVEAIEALERGEGTKGREIVRVVATKDGDDPNALARHSTGPHKLLLQDAKGATVFGIELKRIEGVALGMSIGTKICLKNVTAARGVLLLEPATASLLGGKIDALHKDWKENRKARLKAAVEPTD